MQKTDRAPWTHTKSLCPFTDAWILADWLINGKNCDNYSQAGNLVSRQLGRDILVHTPVFFSNATLYFGLLGQVAWHRDESFLLRNWDCLTSMKRGTGAKSKHKPQWTDRIPAAHLGKVDLTKDDLPLSGIARMPKVSPENWASAWWILQPLPAHAAGFPASVFLI